MLAASRTCQCLNIPAHTPNSTSSASRVGDCGFELSWWVAAPICGPFWQVEVCREEHFKLPSSPPNEPQALYISARLQMYLHVLGTRAAPEALC